MKTRMPWNIKPGDKIRVQSFIGGHFNYMPVVAVKKTRGYHTGASVWKYTLENGEVVSYHGKLNRLPAQRVTIA